MIGRSRSPSFLPFAFPIIVADRAPEKKGGFLPTLE